MSNRSEKPVKHSGDEADAGGPRLTPLREMQLVDLYREGDTEAAAELLGGYQRRVYSICFRMLHDAEEARDLAQDSMVKILEGLDTYDGRSKLSTWIIRVTMNCCLSYLRKKKLRTHQSLDRAPGSSTEGIAPGRFRMIAEPPAGDSGSIARGSKPGAGAELSGPQRVEQAETRALLVRALDRLDPDYRVVLVLRDMQDLDYQQVGAVLDLPIGTVKSRLFRARAALRDLLLELSGGSGTGTGGPDLGTGGGIG